MANELPEYAAWVRRRPCAHCSATQLIEAHHATSGLLSPPGEPQRGKRGKGQKVHDYYLFALCIRCHRQFHDAAGPFKTWSKQRRSAWQLEQVTASRCAWEEEQGTTDGTQEWLDSLPF